MKQLTDEEIVKAFKYCIDKEKLNCSECPLRKVQFCKEIALNGISKIFDRQKAEIEKLTNAYKQCAWERDVFEKECKTAKPDAYKVFAKKFTEVANLKQTIFNGKTISQHYEINKKDFEKFVQGMVSENDR